MRGSVRAVGLLLVLPACGPTQASPTGAEADGATGTSHGTSATTGALSSTTSGGTGGDGTTASKLTEGTATTQDGSETFEPPIDSSGDLGSDGTVDTGGGTSGTMEECQNNGCAWLGGGPFGGPCFDPNGTGCGGIEFQMQCIFTPGCTWDEDADECAER